MFYGLIQLLVVFRNHCFLAHLIEHARASLFKKLNYKKINNLGIFTNEASAYIGLLAPSACFLTAALLSSFGGNILDQIIPILLVLKSHLQSVKIIKC